MAIHKFSKGGYNFHWIDGMWQAFKDGKLVSSMIDVHLKSDEDVWKQFMLSQHEFENWDQIKNDVPESGLQKEV